MRRASPLVKTTALMASGVEVGVVVGEAPTLGLVVLRLLATRDIISDAQVLRIRER